MIQKSLAVKFLQQFNPDGVINLVAIHPISNLIIGITCNKINNDIAEFINEHNGTHNLYFTVNTPDPSAPNSKLIKSHIKTLTHVYVDVDPDPTKSFTQERTRLKQHAQTLSNDLICPPTFIIDSGGGYQFFWRLKTPLENTNTNKIKIEAIGKSLARKFSGDNVQNIDRIMRLPGTVNIPTPKKQKTGRKNTQSKIIEYTTTNYELKELIQFAPPVYDQPTLDAPDNIKFDLTKAKAKQSKQIIYDRLKQLTTTDERLERILKGLSPEHAKSRSERDMALTARLKFHGWDVQDVGAALLIFTHGKHSDLTSREIIRNYTRVITSATHDFNPLPQTIINKIKAQDADPQHRSNRSKINKSQTPDKQSDTHLTIVYYKDAEPINTIPLIYNVLDQHSLAVMYGDSNIGKSFVALDMAGHIASNTPWDNRYTQHGSVLYLASEAGKGIYKRIKALREHKLKQAQAALGFIPQQINFHDPTVHLIEILKSIDELESMTGQPCKLIVIDTLAQTFGSGNENSSEDMGQYIKNANKIIEKTGTTILLIHHSGKDDLKGARGHSSLRAAADTELKIQFNELNQRVIQSRKQRDDEMEKSLLFNLTPVTVGMGTRPVMNNPSQTENFDITSCIVNTVTDPGFEFQSTIPLTKNEQAIITVFHAHRSHTDKLSTQQLATGYQYVIEHNISDHLAQDYRDEMQNLAPKNLNDLSASQKRAFIRSRSNLEDKAIIEKIKDNYWKIADPKED